MKNIKITIEYDGTAYHGWQSQDNAIAVQSVVEKALSELTSEKISITGASRTDTGVHAYGQVANFLTCSSIPPEKYSLAANHHLPADVSIVYSEEVPEGFHSRFSSKGKRYKYIYYNSRTPSALLRNRAFHVPVRLDTEAMREASLCFLGTHDFKAFQATGGNVKTTIRTISRIELVKNDKVIELNIEGDGFLYNMVRIIAGTLVDVGMGRIPAKDVVDIIRSGDRKKSGRTAPPQGLYLVEVFY